MSYYQRIYDLLRGTGLTEAGALGILGNWECESNCEPGRVQGDFSSFRSISKAYVNAISLFQLSKEAFAKDQKGFGLAQWTYPARKRELYDFWRSSGTNIDDLGMQVRFALKEFERDFASDFKLLKTTNDIYVATKAVCDRFENPAVKNYDARFRAAIKIKYEINLNTWEKQEPIETPAQQPEEGWEKIPATEYWPPRGSKGGREDPGLCLGMSGDDVVFLQACLKARGFSITDCDGNFGTYLKETVVKFQEAYDLDADGIVGPKTWKKLLEWNL